MDQATEHELLRMLGVNLPADFRVIEQMPFEQGLVALEALKDRVRANWKKLAFALHPDRTGNDPAKTEQFKQLSALRDKLEKVGLRRAPPPPPPMPVRHVYFHPFVTLNVNTSATTAATTSYGPGGPWFVATMRPI